jgi:hypothetical protein
MAKRKGLTRCDRLLAGHTTHRACQTGGLSMRRLRHTVGLVVLAVLTFSAAWFLPGQSTVRAGWYNVVPPWSATGLSIDFQVEVGDVVYSEVAAAGSKYVGFKLYAPGHGGPYWGTPWYSGEMLRYTVDVRGRCELIVEGRWGLANTWPPVYYALAISVTPGTPTTTTTTSSTTTTTTIPGSPTFTDVSSSHPYFSQINAVAGLGIVTGYGGGLFGPNNLVMRQQFAKMIVRALDLPRSESDICTFTDVVKDTDPIDPLFPDHYVAVCAAYHITDGTSPGKFSPYANLTRAQLITMVARAANLPEPPLGYSPPFGNFSNDHYPWARKAAYAGLLEGLEGMGSGYDFWVSATRGEVCVLLYNLLQR